MDIKKNANPVKTVLVITVGFIIVFLVTKLIWTIYVAVAVGVLGMLSDRLAYYIDLLWMKLAKVLSYIVPNILLTLVFYLFLFPVATLSKLFGGSKMLQLKDKPDTAWVDRTDNMDKASFEKMW